MSFLHEALPCSPSLTPCSAPPPTPPPRALSPPAPGPTPPAHRPLLVPAQPRREARQRPVPCACLALLPHRYYRRHQRNAYVVRERSGVRWDRGERAGKRRCTPPRKPWTASKSLATAVKCSASQGSIAELPRNPASVRRPSRFSPASPYASEGRFDSGSRNRYGPRVGGNGRRAAGRLSRDPRSPIVRGACQPISL